MSTWPTCCSRCNAAACRRWASFPADRQARSAAAPGRGAGIDSPWGRHCRPHCVSVYSIGR
jgi:hypothetical protein